MIYNRELIIIDEIIDIFVGGHMYSKNIKECYANKLLYIMEYNCAAYVLICINGKLDYYFLEDEDLCWTLDVIHLELRLSNDEEAQYFEIS